MTSVQKMHNPHARVVCGLCKEVDAQRLRDLNPWMPEFATSMPRVVTLP